MSEAERQLCLPGRKQQIEHAGIAIVEDVGEASSNEHAPAGDGRPGHRGNGWGKLHYRVALDHGPGTSIQRRSEKFLQQSE